MKAQVALLRTVLELHPDDAARAVETLGAEQASRILKTMPSRTVLNLMERLQPHVAAEILQQVPDEHCCEVLEQLNPQDALAIMKHFPDQQREQLLIDLPAETAKTRRELSQYPEDTAGGMMETTVASLALDLTAQQTIAAIRKAPRDNLYYLYVTERDGRLAGVLSMRDLLLASPRNPIAPLVHHDVLSVPATMPREEVVNIMSEHKFLALPVVDFQGKLVGVVTDRDIAIRCVARGDDPRVCVAADVMTDGVVAMRDDISVEDLAEAMRDNRVRRILLTDENDRLVGLVSQADLARHLDPDMAGRTVREISEPSERASAATRA